MRFIFTFLVVAVAAFTLTWYVGYDYNTFEYRLIKTIIVKVHHYFDENVSHTVDDDDAEHSSTIECNSWSTLNVLVDKLYKRVFDAYTIMFMHPSPKLSENLNDDVKEISFVIDNFHGRITSAVSKLPNYLFPIRMIIGSMQRDLFELNGKFVKASSEMLEQIDVNFAENRETLFYRLAAFLRRMNHVVETEKDSALECICTASVQLDGISEIAVHTVNDCFDDVEYRVRDILNSTKIRLNANLDQTIALLEETHEKQISAVDNFFQLPVHVSILK